ncbi:hypothetical protein GCM10011409_39450 [Lentibacillus populi]|uniref:GP-PDE domain-containing protein n=1 Tax=Lentibacillus populi TaxID=1827502 RepID=A0A9W5X741_9BACI|nr:DUF4176 domain-containing protein [Lentibacillus populi]GGB58053.1 hypothetical protein GCM10011409_39450 [Lentibacillus populi]
MENELLPNGTIVLLDGGNKKLMIYGRRQLLVDDEQSSDEEETTMYDYLGVPYPEGYINPEYTYVFNHSDIVEVIFKGFLNEEEKEFQSILKQA